MVLGLPSVNTIILIALTIWLLPSLLRQFGLQIPTAGEALGAVGGGLSQLAGGIAGTVAAPFMGAATGLSALFNPVIDFFGKIVSGIQGAIPSAQAQEPPSSFGPGPSVPSPSRTTLEKARVALNLGPNDELFVDHCPTSWIHQRSVVVDNIKFVACRRPDTGPLVPPSSFQPTPTAPILITVTPFAGAQPIRIPSTYGVIGGSGTSSSPFRFGPVGAGFIAT